MVRRDTSPMSSMRLRNWFVLTAIGAVSMTAVASIPSHSAAQLSGRRAASTATSGNSVRNLVDYGGAIIPNAKVYAIWWGPTSQFPADEQSHVTTFLKGFGNSSYLQIAQQYMRGAALTATYNGAFFDPSTPVKPNTAALAAEIQKVLAAKHATADPNGIYVVLSSIFMSGDNCAWHNGATINGTAIAQAYIPVPPDGICVTPGDFDGTGSSAATRSIVDSAAHELMESITDKTPGSNTKAWVDGALEMADKCATSYGGPVKIGGSNWEIQEEWSNTVSGCVQNS
jgi:hypothetical protein